MQQSFYIWNSSVLYRTCKILVFLLFVKANTTNTSRNKINTYVNEKNIHGYSFEIVVISNRRYFLCYTNDTI